MKLTFVKSAIIAVGIAIVGTTAYTATSISSFVAPLVMSLGGTGSVLTPNSGGVVYSTGSQLAVGTPGSTGVPLLSNGTSPPAFGTDANLAYLDAAQTYTKGQAITPTTISSCGGTVTPNGTASNTYICNMTSNVTLNNPGTVTPGYTYSFQFVQPATGGPFSLTFPSNSFFVFPAGAAPKLSTVANGIDILDCKAYTTSKIYCGTLVAQLGNATPPFTSLAPPTGTGLNYTTAHKIFEDQFTTANLDSTKWNGNFGDDQFGRFGDNGNLPSPYSGPNCDPNDCTHSQGSITFGSQYEDPFPYAAGTTNLSGNHLTGGSGVLQLTSFPDNNFSSLGYLWASAGVSTYGHSATHAYLPAAGGYVQWSAKMPDSRYGANAALWLLPGPDNFSGPEVDIQESGNVPDNSIANANFVMASNLHNGVSQQTNYLSPFDLSAAYHTYGVDYNPGVYLHFYLDGQLTASYTNNIPTNSYELIMDLEMFNVQSAGFHTQFNVANHPGPFVLSINDVQIYCRPGSAGCAP